MSPRTHLKRSECSNNFAIFKILRLFPNVKLRVLLFFGFPRDRTFMSKLGVVPQENYLLTALALTCLLRHRNFCQNSDILIIGDCRFWTYVDKKHIVFC